MPWRFSSCCLWRRPPSVRHKPTTPPQTIMTVENTDSRASVGLFVAMEHHRHDDRDLDGRDRQGQHQRAVGLADAVRDRLRMVQRHEDGREHQSDRQQGERNAHGSSGMRGREDAELQDRPQVARVAMGSASDATVRRWKPCLPRRCSFSVQTCTKVTMAATGKRPTASCCRTGFCTPSAEAMGDIPAGQA